MRTAFLLSALLLAGPAFAKDTYPPVETLLSSKETVIGQDFTYPEGDAKITAAIVTMQPGASTGWHVHDAPLFAYILEGEITVDYGPDGKNTYREGDSLIEAFETRHNGTNTGDGIVRILAVFAGAENTPNTVSE
ncbi:cupin domain-containing protein [Pseudoruegeria sp. HB172150]|uniref:cupin domain-containing protein n=1 Tax=Pseudoruegeria sp. HB172150 TaxID=2721164 RepID=UPI001554F6CE|nr:cupin domain-containing protein [Pseudoruegeria sp. HB172150]